MKGWSFPFVTYLPESSTPWSFCTFKIIETFTVLDIRWGPICSLWATFALQWPAEEQRAYSCRKECPEQVSVSGGSEAPADRAERQPAGLQGTVLSGLCAACPLDTVLSPWLSLAGGKEARAEAPACHHHLLGWEGQKRDTQRPPGGQCPKPHITVGICKTKFSEPLSLRIYFHQSYSLKWMNSFRWNLQQLMTAKLARGKKLVWRSSAEMIKFGKVIRQQTR